MTESEPKIPILSATAFTYEGTATPVPAIVVADLLVNATAPYFNDRDVAMLLAVELAHESGKPPPGFQRIDATAFAVESPRLGPYKVEAVRLHLGENGTASCLAVIPTLAWDFYRRGGIFLGRIVRVDAVAWRAARDRRGGVV